MKTNQKNIYFEIKNWLNEYNKFVINERIDPNYYFSFWIWPKENQYLIPVLVGNLKESLNGRNCILVGWGWNLNLEDDIIKRVINNPIMRTNFVRELRNKIEPDDLIMNFYPEEQNFFSIKVSSIFPLDYVNKQLLFNEIVKVLVVWGKVNIEFQRQADINFT